MNPTQRDDLWDRLTDLALREAVGGKQPQQSKNQIGNVVPASRDASAPGAAAGKGKRPTSAERAGWMRPDDAPRRSTLRVLVVATCLLVGLTLMVVINRAGGDRPWLWPVAKSDGSAPPSPYYIYDDVQYIPKGTHHFDSLVDSITSTVKPDSWTEAGGRSKPVSGTADGEQRGGSFVGGGPKGVEHFSDMAPAGRSTLQGQGAGHGVGHGIAGTREASRSGDERERIVKF